MKTLHESIMNDEEELNNSFNRMQTIENLKKGFLSEMCMIESGFIEHNKELVETYSEKIKKRIHTALCALNLCPFPSSKNLYYIRIIKENSRFQPYSTILINGVDRKDYDGVRTFLVKLDFGNAGNYDNPRMELDDIEVHENKLQKLGYDMKYVKSILEMISN